MQKFSRIGLIGRSHNEEIVDSLNLLVSFLLAREGITIVLDDSVSKLLDGQSKTHRFEICARTEMHSHCDLVIVVGGDGSMLKAAAVLVEQDIPVVGINRGRLGFLTDILPDEIENDLAQVLDGKCKVEPRFLLDVSVERDGQVTEIGCALNDVVLHPGIAAQMIEFELSIDNEFVYNQASDGLIVATPTGSTAYSMSAGGPIMHPKLDALVLVPMYPHSLSSRPIVIDGSSEVSVLIGGRHSTMPQISCDGSVEYTTTSGDRITIKKKTKQLKLLHPEDYNYYETCRSKLGWSNRLGK
jgi:NAD+ kinase